jgi:uncharacterized protein (TIGR03435 family)
VYIPSPGRLVAENSSLDELIRFAYDLKDYQVSGPVWLNDDSESFDILAKAAPDTAQEAGAPDAADAAGGAFQNGGPPGK